MVEIEINYEGDLRCSIKHLLSGVIIQTDAPVDNYGRGECFSPTDLAAAAFGSCLVTIMAITAQRHDIDLTGVRVKVRKEMSKDLPRKIIKLEADYFVPLPIDYPKRKLLESAASNCPIHHSLHPDIEQKVIFYWQGEQP